MIKNILVITALSILVSSCNFSEECEYYGTFRASVDWSEIDDEYAPPGVNDLRVILFPLSGEALSSMNIVSEGFNTNNYRKDLRVGEYDAILYNPANYGLENTTTSKEMVLTIPTTTRSEDEFISLDLLPVYVASKENVVISHEDTTMISLTPTLFLQTLEFNILVKNKINSQIWQLEAELNGVATQKYLISGNVGEKYGIQSFIPQKNLSEVEKELYNKSFYILGMNNQVSNDLVITLQFMDGNSVSTSVDLSDHFKNFTAAKAIIDIEVSTGEYSANSSILDWKEVEWGELFNNKSIN